MFNDQGYPHFFRIIPSENEYNAPRLSVLKYFNWSIVGTIYQNEANYALVKKLQKKQNKTNITYVLGQQRPCFKTCRQKFHCVSFSKF